MMRMKFTASQVNSVMSQSVDVDCACPAQVCGAIVDLRELYDYQKQCSRDTDNDQRMHDAIAVATAAAHEIMETCLKDILTVEGWDLKTLIIPEHLKAKRAAQS